ncbi:MAG TPA: hypothetical protein VJ723_13175 [Candidatus Angelobacter sp.]|nr:hypothetical protein [Candidatus Angelobacter sp.]
MGIKAGTFERDRILDGPTAPAHQQDQGAKPCGTVIAIEAFF